MTSTEPLVCSTNLARRIEQAEVDLIRAANSAARRRGMPGFLMSIAGGVASFADQGSPYNKVTGLGFDGVPDADELDQVERAFATHGAPTQVELSHLADPTIGTILTARGYRLESFENVLGRSLGATEAPVPLPGFDIDRSGDDEHETWLAVMADAAAHADTEGVPGHEEFPRAVYVQAMRDAADAGVRRYKAVRAGVLAGGAELRLVGGIAQFAGAATAPEHRRHGIQNALLGVRLADAAAEGCDLAVIVTQPGSKSHPNAQRRGFPPALHQGHPGQDTRSLTGIRARPQPQQPSRGGHPHNIDVTISSSHRMRSPASGGQLQQDFTRETTTGSLGYRHVDVFADRPFTGNGLVIVFCRSLDHPAQRLRAVATEMRQFETIFVDAHSDGSDVAARIFTVEEELPFAGHPLLGAAAALHERRGSRQARLRWRFLIQDRPVTVTSEPDGNYFSAAMDQGLPDVSRPLPHQVRADAAAALGLAPDHLAPLPVQVISTGLPYLIIPVTTEGLSRARISREDFEVWLNAFGAKFVYVLDVNAAEGRTWDNAGTVEDVATGSAAGPAAAYIAEHAGREAAKPLTLHQGRFVSRPSTITVTTDVDHHLWVSGSVRPVAAGVLDTLPPMSA